MCIYVCVCVCMLEVFEVPFLSPLMMIHVFENIPEEKYVLSSSYELWVMEAECPYLHKLHRIFMLPSWKQQSLENKQGIIVQYGYRQLSW